jgi:hypothetical protein
MLKTVSTANGLVSPTFSGNVTLSDGNLVIGTSGKGIDFSATPGTGTSELLDDYEEGTWTGTLIGSTAPPTTPVTATGKYTKIGRQVVVSVAFSNADTTGATGNLRITGLPFTAGSTPDHFGSVIQDGFGASVITCLTDAATSDVRFFTSVGLGNVSVSAGAGKYLWLTLTYFV